MCIYTWLHSFEACRVLIWPPSHILGPPEIFHAIFSPRYEHPKLFISILSFSRRVNILQWRNITLTHFQMEKGKVMSMRKSETMVRTKSTVLLSSFSPSASSSSAASSLLLYIEDGLTFAIFGLGTFHTLSQERVIPPGTNSSLPGRSGLKWDRNGSGGAKMCPSRTRGGSAETQMHHEALMTYRSIPCSMVYSIPASDKKKMRWPK